ncbi:MAG: hypothetical protein RR707_00070 [Comamonas sp.]
MPTLFDTLHPRAKRDLAAAQQANAEARAIWWQQQAAPLKRCGSCGAPIHKEPAEGEGLPCGH